MSERDLVRTGIYGLDRVFLGGITRGNVILVEGITGTGKTIFGIECIYRGIMEYGEPGMIVTFETSPRKMMRDAMTFGWDLDKLQQNDKLKVIFTSPQVLLHELSSPDSLLLETAVQIGARRLFIDGINLLREQSGTEGVVIGEHEYRTRLQHLIDGLNREDLTSILSHELLPELHNGNSAHTAEFLADTVVHLRRECRDWSVQRTIEIVKSRGQDFDPGRHSLAILDGKGLQVFRRVQMPPRSRAVQPSSHEAQTAIGIQVLDDLFGGGIYRGSTTMMCGVSGIGKTILGLQLLLCGATKMNQKGLHISLDEHPQQIHRNADTLKLGLRDAVESGMIHVFHEYPQELEINAHFDRIRRTIEENDIQRLVIDGMTGYSTAMKDQRGYRDFFHTLVSFVKQRLMLSFFSYETSEVFEITHFMPEFPVSSVVDNIIVMNYVELGAALRRSITVAKSRGRRNQFITREFVIGEGGITMPADDGEPLPHLPFSRYYGLLSRAPTRISPDFGDSHLRRGEQ